MRSFSFAALGYDLAMKDRKETSSDGQAAKELRNQTVISADATGMLRDEALLRRIEAVPTEDVPDDAV